VNPADFALRNRTLVLVLTVVMLLGGMVSYQGLSRLEDPEFTIKEALVITPYPGASAAEVELEVSDRLEIAVQQLGQLDEVESKSDRGLSTLNVRIQDKYDKSTLPQVWDELRRKVGDAQGDLPPGAGPSLVVDDFGDVWGVFVAIYGDEYSYAELLEFAKLLRRELLLVDDVAKIDFWGERQEVIYIEPDRDRTSQLGIYPQMIARELRDKNLVAQAGRVEVGPEFIAIQPTGIITSTEAFETLLLSAGGDEQIQLRDVATVRRGYAEPPAKVLRYDGEPAIGLGISTVAGGNVVTMGEAVRKRAAELQEQWPLGIEVGAISVQSQAVTVAIDNFLVSLYQAVAIVIVVLLFFMGLRSGLLIGFVLVLTITGTFIFMGPWAVALERISLGALIIALGMLVDNAIVVVDGMLIRMEAGQEPEDAGREVIAQTALPLLGATAVAIMAFAAIGTSQDSTGEFCRSLFQVVLISLGLSWVTGVTVTPVLGAMFLKVKVKGTTEEEAPPEQGGGPYRGLLEACLRARAATVLVVLAIFGASLFGFGYVDRSFFPNSTRPQFMLDVWLPQGTHIDVTTEAAAEIEEYLAELEGSSHVTSLIGAGGMRFLLTYTAEKVNPAYIQFLVDVDDYRLIDGLIAEVEARVPELVPDAAAYGRKFVLGPGTGGKIQVRVRGKDADVLRVLAGQLEAILYDDGDAKAIRNEWRSRVKVLEPVLAEEEANRAGITREDVAGTLFAAFQGVTSGVYREGDDLLPIVVRAPEPERSDVRSANDLQVWSDRAGRAIPLRQVVSRFETGFEDEIIIRLDRERMIKVHADPATGQASTLLARIMPEVDAIELPPGYSIEWGGEYEDSADAQAAMMGSIPAFLVAMVVIVIGLFNGLRQTAVIWLTVPLALIGVTWGLLLTGQPFGFMALLGFMSLSGMLIKNAVVLVDEIEVQKRDKEPYRAIVDSGVSRLRPVAMAAATTALGMIPLLLDAFFISMAVTIIGGLVVATVLTMIVVPVLYALFFGVRAP
jgi:multidrug efflux pump subunit AcrB